MVLKSHLCVSAKSKPALYSSHLWLFLIIRCVFFLCGHWTSLFTPTEINIDYLTTRGSLPPISCPAHSSYDILACSAHDALFSSLPSSVVFSCIGSWQRKKAAHVAKTDCVPYSLFVPFDEHLFTDALDWIVCSSASWLRCHASPWLCFCTHSSSRSLL